MFFLGYAVIDGLADGFGTLTDVQDVLEQPASFPVEPLQTLSDLVMSTLPGNDLLKVENNGSLWNQIVNYGVESLEKRLRRYRNSQLLFYKEASSEYKECNRGQMWSAKRGAKLNVWLGHINELLNLNSAKKNQVFIRSRKCRFVIMEMKCLQ